MKNDTRAELAISYESVSNLAPYPGNARTHSQRQLRQIAASIEEFGFTSPILVDRTNTIIAGHGRIAAAKLLGIEQVPTIRLENLTQDQIRAYVLADNRLAEKAGWDKSILAIELQHLLTIDSSFDVTITGFEVPEIDLILGPAGENGRSEDDIFKFDVSATAITQPGDLWQLARHRVFCGNSLDVSSFKGLIAL